MGTVASQITSLTIVYSMVHPGLDQRKHQSSASLALVLGIHWWLVNSPHKGPVMWKMFPFDDIIKPLLTTLSGTTRTTRTPAFWGYPPPPNDYPYHWVILDPKSKEDKVKVTNLKNSPKFQIFEFWNGHYTGHTFWSCLIRCANMKWIRWVFLKIQSGHDSVHRRTDGQTDKVIPVYPPFNFVEAGV